MLDCQTFISISVNTEIYGR